MTSGEGWLMRPVTRNMCLYESLKNGVIDLEDISRMNEALDVETENENRYRKSME